MSKSRKWNPQPGRVTLALLLVFGFFAVCFWTYKEEPEYLQVASQIVQEQEVKNQVVSWSEPDMEALAAAEALMPNTVFKYARTGMKITVDTENPDGINLRPSPFVLGFSYGKLPTGTTLTPSWFYTWPTQERPETNRHFWLCIPADSLSEPERENLLDKGIFLSVSGIFWMAHSSNSEMSHFIFSDYFDKYVPVTVNLADDIATELAKFK